MLIYGVHCSSIHALCALFALSTANRLYRRSKATEKEEQKKGGKEEDNGEKENEKEKERLAPLVTHATHTVCASGLSPRIFSPLFGPPSVGPDAGSFMRYCLIIRRQYRGPLVSHL